MFQCLIAIYNKTNLIPIIKKVLKIEPMIMFIIIFIPFFNGDKIFFIFHVANFKIIIYEDKLYLFILILIRVMSILLILMIYTSSFTFSEFVSLRIFPDIISSIIIIMLNFIPEFFNQNTRIIEAKKLKGIDYNHSKVFKIKNFGYSLGNNLVYALNHSERLYEGMILRGFHGKIKPQSLKITIFDIKFILINIFGLLLISLIIKFL